MMTIIIMIIIMQAGGQDDCHNHNIRGIAVQHINSDLCLKCPFPVVHIIVKSFVF